MNSALNIALVGYGKMGKAIDTVAQSRGHAITHRIDSTEALNAMDAGNVDVAIEFTKPDSAIANFKTLIDKGIPTVTGTTGWLDAHAQVEALVHANDGALLWGSNFSIGVNVLFQANRQLAELMNRYDQYDAFVEERHHKYKKDSPSGTARTIADDIVERLDRKRQFVLSDAYAHRPPEPDELTLGVIRTGEIPGTHTVGYNSAVDQITLQHQAFGREGFALGAVIAAEWLAKGAKGLLAFHDLFETGEL